MALSIVGVGLGRTGTLSLKTAIERLGFGPCFHCLDGPESLIQRALSLARNRHAVDWNDIFHDYNSAVDVPFSWFYRDIVEQCPSAKFILTVREPNTWFESTQAIRPLVDATDPAHNSVDRMSQQAELSACIPPELDEILKFQDRNSVIAAFERFNMAVQKAIPADRLLVMDVKRGWAPLCEFVGVSIPVAPFPRVNSREEFPALLRRMLERRPHPK